MYARSINVLIIIIIFRVYILIKKAFPIFMNNLKQHNFRQNQIFNIERENLNKIIPFCYIFSTDPKKALEQLHVIEKT